MVLCSQTNKYKIFLRKIKGIKTSEEVANSFDKKRKTFGSLCEIPLKCLSLNKNVKILEKQETNVVYLKCSLCL